MSENFEEHALFIMKELERLGKAIDRLDEKMASLKFDIEALKIKSGLWGAAGAAIPVVGLLLYQLVAKVI